MTDVFAERLASTGRTWRWLRGDRRARVELAVEAVEALLGGWRVEDLAVGHPAQRRHLR